MITVRPDVTYRERRAWGDLLFDLQRVRFHGGGLEIRLYTAGRNLRARGDRSAGNNVDARKRDVLEGKDGVERAVLVEAITKIVVQCVIQPEACANHGGLRRERGPGNSETRRRQKFRIINGQGRIADDRVGYDHSIRIEHIVRSAATTLVPAAGEFTTETDAQLEVRCQLESVLSKQGSFKRTPTKRGCDRGDRKRGDRALQETLQSRK